MDKLTWSEPALRQLEEILEVIALDKPEAAVAVARKIFEAADNVERFRLLGRAIPEFPAPGYRQLWMQPCWIYYRIAGKDIILLHVRRAGRPFDPAYLEDGD
jgi:toxin ParE1/3/4